MARRKRSGTMTLSGAAVDLLSCGLAAAAVMWILVLPNSGYLGEGTRDRVNGVVRLSQFGLPHLFQGDGTGRSSTIEVSFPNADPIAKFQVARHLGGLSFLPLLEDEVVSPTGPGTASMADAQIVLTASNPTGFAAEVSILFRDVPPGTTVRVRFDQCYAGSEPHALQAMVADRQGVTTSLLFWQRAGDLQAALNQSYPTRFEEDPTKEDYNAWFKTIASMLREQPDRYLGDRATGTKMFAWRNPGSGTTTTRPQTLEIRATTNGLIKLDPIKRQTAGGPSHIVDRTEEISLRTRLRAWCAKAAISAGLPGACDA